MSVIIPSFNRAQDLGDCLQALSKQRSGQGEYEVIVVDDGSSDNTEDLVAGLGLAYPVPLLYKQQSNLGPASARNLGARCARGDVLAFTDSDCVPSLTWIERLIRWASLHPDSAAVEGSVFPLGEVTPSSRVIVADGPGCFLSANMAFRREAFVRLGGFDQDFRFACCEDLDLAYRALEQDFNIDFDADLLVYHKVTRRDPLQFLSHRHLISSHLTLYRKHVGLYRKRKGTGIWTGFLLSGIGGTISSLKYFGGVSSESGAYLVAFILEEALRHALNQYMLTGAILKELLLRRRKAS